MDFDTLSVDQMGDIRKTVKFGSQRAILGLRELSHCGGVDSFCVVPAMESGPTDD